MNPELVEQITKLVLERLEEKGTGERVTLSQAEIKRWDEISASIQRNDSRRVCRRISGKLPPLSAQEIERWNMITVRFDTPTTHTGKPFDQVKFRSYT